MTKKAILVVDPKGGSGKTTLVTDLAGALANAGEDVVLWDVDRQRSSLHWLAMRPADRPLIGWPGSGAGGEAARRNRSDSRTRASATLEAFLAQFRRPVITYLRDTQVYVNAAFNGLSIFDLPDYVSSRDVEQWQPLLEWITDF